MLREQRKLFNKIRRNALIYVRYEHFRLFGSVLCSTQNNEYYFNTLFTPYPKYQASYPSQDLGPGSHAISLMRNLRIW